MAKARPTYGVLDLFSGIGGFTLAFGLARPAASFRTVGFSEISPFACSVLSARWPKVPNFGEVGNVTREGILARCGCLPAVVTGGFPCQPHSMAGKRLGSADERDLWSECARVLGDVRPRFALFENVAGLLVSDGGMFFNRVLSDLASLGYDCLWQVLPASALGASHRRDRVWLLCADARRGKAQVVAADEEHVGLDWPASRGEWPARPGEPQNQWEPPRTVLVGSGDSDDPDASGSGRAARLKALGNAIVPQAAAVFADVILGLLSGLPTARTGGQHDGLVAAVSARMFCPVGGGAVAMLDGGRMASAQRSLFGEDARTEWPSCGMLRGGTASAMPDLVQNDSSRYWLTATAMQVPRADFSKRAKYRASVGRQYSPGCLEEHVAAEAAGICSWQSPSRAESPDLAAQRAAYRLNPDWVEALMGYPVGWTDLRRDGSRRG